MDKKNSHIYIVKLQNKIQKKQEILLLLSQFSWDFTNRNR